MANSDNNSFERPRAINYEQRIESATRSVENSKMISPNNKKLLFAFKEHYYAKGMSKPRVAKCITVMKSLAIRTEKDFDKMKRADIEKLVAQINKENVSDWTKCDFQIWIRLLFQWLKKYPKDNNPFIKYPPEVAWIKPKMPKPRAYKDDEMLNHADIKKIIKTAESPMMKALIATLYNSMGRAEEIATLTIGDVTFDKYGCVIHIKYSKTGVPRSTRLVFASAYLQNWINNFHPMRNDPKAPLFISLSSRKSNKNKQLMYHEFWYRIKEIVKKSGISKPCNLHHFRKSYANYCAEFIMPHHLEVQGGWTKGSRALRQVYIQHSKKKSDDAMLRMEGIELGGKKPEPEIELLPKVCERCNTTNETTNKFCSLCQAPLSLSVALELDQESDHFLEKLVTGIRTKPKLREALKEIFAEETPSRKA